MEKISRLLKIILIACYSMFSFVDNLSAQETWEEIIEQLVVNDENDSYSYENIMEELAELKSNPIPTKAVIFSLKMPSSITSSRLQTIKESDIAYEVIRNVEQLTASAVGRTSAVCLAYQQTEVRLDA